MPTQYRFPLHPAGAKEVNEVLARPGPKGRHKLTGPRLQEAQAQLDAGASLRAAAAAVGVREGTLRHALGRGDLRRPAAAPAAPPAAPPAPAPPRFAAAEAVQGAGVLCALPALLQHGLLAVGEHVYGRLRNGFYGLRSVLLTLAVLALLRVRTSEQLQGHALQGGRAERWIAQAPDAIGFLYIDAHVRPYHGHAHRLPEAHVARRRLCLPATTDFYLNDQAAAPVFLVP